MNDRPYFLLKNLFDRVTRNHMKSSDWIDFTQQLHKIYDEYCESVIDTEKKQVACLKGCSLCCNHWVEDVYSFESNAIINFLKVNYPKLLQRISIESSGAEQEMEELSNLFTFEDETQLLQKFYELNIPCPLLNAEGDCIIYEVRPLTCRSFFSRDRNRFCQTPVIDDEIDGTYMVLFGEQIESILDEIHFLVDNYHSVPTSLRSMLANCINKQ